MAAVERALTIVEAVQAAPQGSLSLAELAGETGLYKSTLLRLLASLEHRALVVRRVDQRYGLGPLALRLGHAFEAQHPLEDRLAVILHELVEQGTESPSFHVRYDATRRLCLLRVDSHHSTLDRVRTGDLLPLDQGAAGRILLAWGDRGATTMPRPPATMVSRGERDPLCGAVAAPVFGARGELAGALSLSGPLERFSPSSIARMRRLLVAAAGEATHALGGPPASPRRSGGERPDAGRAGDRTPARKAPGAFRESPR